MKSSDIQDAVIQLRIRSAQQCITNGNYSKATSLLESALEFSKSGFGPVAPQTGRVLVWLEECYETLGDMERHASVRLQVRAICANSLNKMGQPQNSQLFQNRAADISPQAE